jgi:hypothetical protein
MRPSPHLKSDFCRTCHIQNLQLEQHVERELESLYLQYEDNNRGCWFAIQSRHFGGEASTEAHQRLVQ